MDLEIFFQLQFSSPSSATGHSITGQHIWYFSNLDLINAYNQTFTDDLVRTARRASAMVVHLHSCKVQFSPIYHLERRAREFE